MINWNNLDTLNSYKKMLSLKGQVKLADVLDADRVKKYETPMAGGLVYNYAAKQVNEPILTVLQELSAEQQLVEKYKALLDGDVINTGENRKVLPPARPRPAWKGRRVRGQKPRQVLRRAAGKDRCVREKSPRRRSEGLEGRQVYDRRPDRHRRLRPRSPRALSRDGAVGTQKRQEKDGSPLHLQRRSRRRFRHRFRHRPRQNPLYPRFQERHDPGNPFERAVRQGLPEKSRPRLDQAHDRRHERDEPPCEQPELSRFVLYGRLHRRPLFFVFRGRRRDSFARLRQRCVRRFPQRRPRGRQIRSRVRYPQEPRAPRRPHRGVRAERPRLPVDRDPSLQPGAFPLPGPPPADRHGVERASR